MNVVLATATSPSSSNFLALYPHLTAYDNIAFPLRANRESRADIDRKVREVAKTLQIEDLLGQATVDFVRRRHATCGDRARARS